jgi:hypothetical protein
MGNGIDVKAIAGLCIAFEEQLFYEEIGLISLP